MKLKRGILLLILELMKAQETWFAEYAESHQNKLNQKIHYICVPAIFFSIVGMISSIPANLITNTLQFSHPIFGNYATLVLILLMIFYIRLRIKTFVLMAVFSIVSLYGNYYLSQITPLFYTSLGIFVIAWIGQFYGHEVEGKKPSFIKDIQFLLIGPAWVFEKMTR
ncbi:MAG: YGL010W-like membrane protein [Salibacteraceae bacterium]|jgi:uncharacterized membrane protein YGL010W